MMKNHLRHSLSKKILLPGLLLMLLTVVVLYFVVSDRIQKTLVNSEKEKAALILRTVAPVLSVDLYLDLKKQMETLTGELMQNKNILSLTLRQNGEVLLHHAQGDEDSSKGFSVQNPIMHPVTHKPYALLTMRYSAKNYYNLRNELRFMFLGILTLLMIIAGLYAYYIRKMILPLRTIAEAVKTYRPNQAVALPEIASMDETGMIARAFASMTERLGRYDAERLEYEQRLEKEVLEKTAQLQYRLYHHSLTDLNNRLALGERLKSEKSGCFAVLDIDRFGQINDLFGEAVGDRILVKIGNLVVQYFLHENSGNFDVYHLTADTFAVFSSRNIDLDTFERILDGVIHAIESESFEFNDVPLHLRLSAGGVVGTKNALEKADIALKAARLKKVPYLIYDERFRMEENYANNQTILRQIKTAINENGVAVFVQPIFDNRDGSIYGYECLMRLTAGGEGFISPDQFIPLAKKARYYPQLTRLLAAQCCRCFARTDLRFSINISLEDILDADTVSFLKNEILRHDVGRQLTFELLETENIEGYSEVMGFVSAFKAMGVRFAIDDFGSGYSNFKHLISLDIDILKIDGSLIKNIDSQENDRRVSEAIVAFAVTQKMQCVAEHVHNEKVLEVVKAIGIRYTQGYVLGKPVPIESLLPR